MGFFKNIKQKVKSGVSSLANTSIYTDAVLAGVSAGIRNTQSKMMGNSVSGNAGADFSRDISKETGGSDFSLFGIEKTYNTIGNADIKGLYDDHLFYYTHRTEQEQDQNEYQKKYVAGETNNYSLSLPKWGYNNYIDERNVFIKHLSNGFDEPGWFYFKVFFDFSSNHGLFGGILNLDQKNVFSSINSAHDYLTQCNHLFPYEKLDERQKCLEKFTKLLSFININSPWFFKSVKNLASVSIPQINQVQNDKSIEIELDQDAVDMRISTLLSLYKYACYDDIGSKEIIPDNLRKFDMCILVFSAPIKFRHNVYSNGEFKQLYNDTVKNQNYMSFKLYKFLNCEISMDSLGGYVGDELKNEQPFGLGQNTLKINYDRVYEYLMNEYMGIMFGSDGIYLDNPIIEIDNRDIAGKLYSNLTILSEKKIHDNIASLLRNDSRFVLGNVFGQDRALYVESMTNNSSTSSFTDYAKSKFGIISGNKNMILNLGYDILYKLLGTGYNANAEVLKVGNEVLGDGTVLNGHGDYRVGSMVWKAKMYRYATGDTGLSTREKRLNIVNTATQTDWAWHLYNKALNAI